MYASATLYHPTSVMVGRHHSRPSTLFTSLNHHTIQPTRISISKKNPIFTFSKHTSSHSERSAMQICKATSADKSSIKREPTPEVLSILRHADAFCFDVDSTFCQDESIDEIAAFLGVGDEVAALTAKAMGGTVLFQDALAARLGVMKPSSSDIDRFLKVHPHLVTPGIPELLDTLKSMGKKVFLVSGGFRQIIHPLADDLNIPRSHVFANTIQFDRDDGSYTGFDSTEFTSRSGGKGEAVVHIKKEFGLKSIVMVGDGATDAEAKQPGGADLFIGYGGVVFREPIAERADWYIMDIDEIRKSLI